MSVLYQILLCFLLCSRDAIMHSTQKKKKKRKEKNKKERRKATISLNNF